MKSETVIAASRFGLGARPGDLGTIDPNPQGWLIDQLQGPSRLDPEFAGLPRSSKVIVEIQDIRTAQRNANRGENDAPAPDVVEKYGRVVRSHYVRQMNARYRVAAASDYPFHDRLVHFWSNHFAVSGDKQPLPAIAGLFENEAIRPNVSGNFADMLVAVEQHPAMILYLDNQRSIGPGSTLGKRANRGNRERMIGLNENLAREILELHTLGVDGGYSQDDVTTFAKVITGWSIGGASNTGRFADGTPGEFEFRELIHEPGSQQILNTVYSQSGVKQGEAVLRDLAMNASTARFLARKLVQHFVADDPPDALVNKIAGVYLKSGGDLPTVYEALIMSAEPWTTTFAKYKTPHDFVISTFRAFDHIPDDARTTIAALDLMGQTPFRPGSPAGWPDTALEWGGADALLKRIEWSNTVARVVGNRGNPVELGNAVLGPAFSADTRTAVSRAESKKQGTTLFLASPDFQRR